MHTFSSQLEQYEKAFLEELSLVKNTDELEAFRVKHLGRQGILQDLVQRLKTLDLEEKKVVGPQINTLKETLQEAYKNKEQKFIDARLANEQIRSKNFDIIAYKPFQLQGSLHPYTHVVEQVEDIFISMGFDIVDGPEVEHEYYNFEALNIPAYHPARDMQDNLWFNFPSYVMRTHTSSVEIHTMKDRKPPIAIAVPGRAYRNEATDVSHDFMFMQLKDSTLTRASH